MSRSLALVPFLIFAAYWSAVDVVHGLWLQLIPSAVVGLLLVAVAVGRRR